MTNWISDVWYQNDYQEHKKENFKILNSYLTNKPAKILDIGCGLAWESRMFNEQYGSELWLLDGDANNNDIKSAGARDVDYNDSVDNFLYYYSLQELDEQLKKLGTKNYHLIDCNNINIADDVKFDLITSWVSCGFHYPASTYRNLILKHSHPGTKIIFDLRVPIKKQDPILEKGVQIVHKLNRRKKYFTSEIKFI